MNMWVFCAFNLRTILAVVVIANYSRRSLL